MRYVQPKTHYISELVKIWVPVTYGEFVKTATKEVWFGYIPPSDL